MAYNPSEEELINLMVSADPATAADIQAVLNQIQQGAENINASLEKASATSGKVVDNLSQMGAQTAKGLDEATASAEGLATQLEKINSLSQKPPNLPEQGYINQLPQFAGAGTFVPPQSENPDIEPPTIPTDPQKIGSFFSLAHGLSVAGHALGAPALREAGGAIYVEEGIRKTLPMFEQMGLSMTSLVGVGLPLVAAFVAIGAEMNQLNKIIQDGIKAVDDAVTAQQKYYEYTATHTSEQAKEQIKQDEVTRDSALKVQQNLKDKLIGLIGDRNTPESMAAAFEALKTKSPEEVGPMLHFAAGVEAPAVMELLKQIKELDDSAGKAQEHINELSGGIQNGDFAAKDAEQAQKDYVQALVDGGKHNAEQAKQFRADDEMSAEAAKKKLAGLQADRQQTMDTMAELAPLVDTSKEAEQQYNSLNTTLSDQTTEIEHLTNVSIPLAQAREREAAAIEALKKNLDAAAGAIDDFGKNKLAAETALQNQIETAKLRETQAEAKQREDTSNAITDIRTKLGQKEAQLTTDYQRQIFDDRTKFYADWAKLQLHANTQSQEDLISHNEKLAEISRRSHTDDQQALLDRNFLQLAKIKQSSTDQVAAENIRFSEQENALQRHLQAQQVDLANALNVEMNQQRINNERKRADAELQANYDIAQARVNESRKLQVIQQGLQNEIALYQLAETQKLAILQSTLNAITSAAFRNIASTVGGVVQSAVKSSPILSFLGGALGFKDEGGPFESGSPFIMSENRPEALNFGSSSFRIPGAAMVMPLTSGSVDRNGGGNNITIPLTINGAQDPETTGRIARREVHQLLQQFFPG